MIRRAQLEYWLEFGGERLRDRLADAHESLGSALDASADAGGTVRRADFASISTEFGRISEDAGDYFPIPDARADALWQKYQALTRAGSSDRVRGFDRGDEKLFEGAMHDFTDGARLINSVGARFDALRHAAPVSTLPGT